MPATDLIHEAVRNALVKDGWTITADPYTLKYEDATVFADLAAERPLAAERGEQRIAVEIKSFIGPSPIHDFEGAPGQYQIYLLLLARLAPERKLYLAVGDTVYSEFFRRESIRMFVQHFRLSILVVNVISEEVAQWID